MGRGDLDAAHRAADAARVVGGIARVSLSAAGGGPHVCKHNGIAWRQVRTGLRRNYETVGSVISGAYVACLPF